MPDDTFDLAEELYHRFHPESFESDELKLRALPVTDMSVNRSKHDGLPIYALLHPWKWKGWGVFAFVVQDIPHQPIHPDHPSWDYQPCHKPSRRNYYHTEIRAYDDGEHVSDPDSVPRDVGLMFRWGLLRRGYVIIKPGDADAEIA